MLNMFEVIETNNMIEHEKLDVRTITMGISLLDCCDDDLQALNEKIYKKHILYMPITEMIWYIPMSLLAFEAYIGSPALIKQSQFPYYENYYTVQGKVVSFERNGSGHTYRSILVLDNGNTYYIPPTLERNYGYEDWLLNKIHSDITSGKEVILQVLDFDNSDYTPAIMSLKCNGVEYFP